MRDARQVGALRLALAGTAVLAGAVLAVPADAASKVRPVCHLVTDDRGDTGAVLFPGTQGVLGTDTDDLLSADVASDGRTLTAVLRLADLQPSDPAAPTGRAYVFSFKVRGRDTGYFLAARTAPTGTRYLYGYFATDETGHGYNVVAGEATGSVSTTAHQVRISAPAAALRPKPVRRGATLLELRASVQRWFGTGLSDGDQVVGPAAFPLQGAAMTFDKGEGDRYVVGTPSCVKP